MAASTSTPRPERERRVAFDGARNFRDLGGYPTRCGGETRWGVLYRADRLHEMTAADLDRFGRLGVVTVIDLRHEDERDRNPDPVPSDLVSLSGAVARHVGVPPSMDLVERDHGAAFLRDRYLGMLTHAAPEIGGVIAGFADRDALPAVFHCTAGKDRTGIVAALVLEVLGVERELVLDDYELTDRFRPFDESSDVFRGLIRRGMQPEAAAGVLGAHRSVMAGALAALDADHGGVEGYLIGPAGLDHATIARLRDLLID